MASRVVAQGRDLLLLRCYPSLREIVLQMLDAAQSHDALSLRRTPTKRFLGLICRVHVWVKCSLSSSLLRSKGCIWRAESGGHTGTGRLWCKDKRRF